MSVPSNREETLFEKALGIDAPEARDAFLREGCGDDATMFARLQGLLGAHDRAGKFLEHKPSASPLGVPPSGGAARGPAEAGTPNPAAPAPSEKPGDRVGRYKLLEEIGEGGFGTVWMAQQEEPVRRRVALKVIKLGMDTRQVLARFEAERQALALMDHPNIARVFDGSATATGRPYFVMELVRGLPITKYCDEARLSTRQRLELFGQVCRAVQHAHQKGIIHRDLKPSNILVTVQDDRPVVKVIDFGIAKATEGRLTDKTLFTGFDQLMGTPAYMSPEQAGLGSLDIDTRSDTYSLGVVLYELLTGRPPFDTQELFKQGYEAVLRTIRETEPVKPSTRLMQESSARPRDTVQSAIGNPPSAIDPDLDWIVMKCLEKDRARRYESATSLAQDLQRHLDCEPVLARPPSAAYRIRKFLRRHRAASRIVAVSALVLVAASVITLVVMRKNRNRVAALKAKADAWDYQRPSLNTTSRVNELLQSLETSAAGAAVRAGTGNLDARTLTYDMARANLFSERFADAERLYREYLDPMRKAGVTNHASLINGLSGLSQALQGQGKFAETEPVLREYLAILERVNTDIWQRSKVRARLGSVLLAQKKFLEAEPQLLQGYEGMMQGDRSNPRYGDLRAPYEQQAGEWIVQLYTDWGKADEAAKWRTKLKAPVTPPPGVQP